MRRGAFFFFVALLSLAPAARAQQMVDRIVARVNSDVITQSDIDELGRFQKLVDGKEQTAPKRLHELVQQWIVQHEASFSGFQAPNAKAVQAALANLEKRFGSRAAFEKKMKEAGLSEADVKHMLEQQIFLSRFLDYKFRPEVQVSEQQIEQYYRKTLVPELKRAGQQVPPLAKVADKVREVLVERNITQLAEAWLKEMEKRWTVEMIGGKSSP